jgi:ribosomal protein L15
MEKQEATAFLDQVRSSGVLKQKKNFRSDVADLLIEEWELTTGQETLKSKFTSPFPASQDEIRNLCAILIKKIKDYHLIELAKAKALQEKGLVKSVRTLANSQVKVLAGDLKKKLTVKVLATASAKAAIEKAGGSVK